VVRLAIYPNPLPMKKIQIAGFAAALLPLLPSFSQAQTPVTIKVATTDEVNIIRRDISRATFGVGVTAQRAEFGWAMKPFVAKTDTENANLSLTADTFKWLQFGSLRFPNGNSSFSYLWSDPIYNVPCPADTPNCNPYEIERNWSWNLNPDDIVTYSDILKMDRVFQVNTIHSPYPGNDTIINNSIFNKEEYPLQLEKAANYAAEWVATTKNKELPNKTHTDFWEIGNEDWSRLDAKNYAKVFAIFSEKMKGAIQSEQQGIKLIAQGLEEDFSNGLVSNKPKDWMDALESQLKGRVNDVYAYAIHDYIDAGAHIELNFNKELKRKIQTQEMFAMVDRHTRTTGKPADIAAVGTVKNLIAEKKLPWKIWMTEFNVQQTKVSASNQKCNEDNKNNIELEFYGVCEETLQDIGHGLVIADWVGKLLEQNIERMYINDFGQGESSEMVHFGLNNTTKEIAPPKVSVPGHVYSMYAKNFGKTMVVNQTDEKIKKGSAKKLSVYSSVSANDQELRIMIVNRDLDNKAVINIDTQNALWRRELADGQYCFRQLSSAKVSDSNVALTDNNAVKWSEPQYLSQSNRTGITNQTLAPASVNLLVIPLRAQNSSSTNAVAPVDCSDGNKDAVAL
jgi:hypothetical protein